MIRRRLLVAAALPVAFGGLPLAAQDAGPTAPVSALNQGLQAISQAGRATPFAQRVAMLAPVVARAFALEDVLRASVGPRYAGLPADQKASLLQVFTDYTLASYVSNFDSGGGNRFVVGPQTRAVGTDQVVSTQIGPASGTPTRLDYVVRNGPAGWQIVDVLIDGSISQVAVQRSDFRRLLSGGSADPLIASLRKRAASLAAGGKG